jgi:hypothetical protein
VRFELAAVVGEERVAPASGPELGLDAELVCDPDRPLAVRVPPSALRRVAELRAVRLPVIAERDIELAGFLTTERVGAGGSPEPGDPLPGGDLTPSEMAAGPDLRWVTLPLARPVALKGGGGVWAIVQVTRGAVRCALAASGATPDDEALVRRQASNGAYRPLPVVKDVPTAAIGLRVVGVPPATAPIEAVTVRVPGVPSPAGAPDPAVVTAVATTPTPDPATHELRHGEAVTAGAPARPAAGTDLLLRLEVSAPGEYTIGPVTVGYEEAP